MRSPDSAEVSAALDLRLLSRKPPACADTGQCTRTETQRLTKLWLLRAMMLIVAVAASCLQAAHGQDVETSAAPVITPSLQITVQKTKAEIGEELPVTFKAPEGAAIKAVKVVPPEGQPPDVLLGEAKLAEGTAADWSFPVRILKAGDHTLGPFTLKIEREGGAAEELATNFVNVAVAEPAIARAEAKEYTDILRAPRNWGRIALFATGLVILLAGMAAGVWWFLARRARRPSPAIPAVPALPPLDEAGRALARLETLEIFRAQGTKAHYSELSSLLRRYFERQMRFQALEMSDDEMIAHLRQAMCGNAAASPLMGVFERSGLAKFARWQCAAEQAREDTSHARAFLNSERDRQRVESLKANGRAESEAA
ncbi:hypothetical protein HZA57_00630 [Candidatus Poribacteria bacterium]|nr:hypothetical protein [Candidatus Poribacteria bacterium]